MEDNKINSDDHQHAKPSDVVIWLCTFLFIFLLPHTGLFPIFTYSVPILLTIWYVLRRSGERFGNVGFRWSDFSIKSAWVGILTGVALFMFTQYVFFPLINLFISVPQADLKDFAAIRSNLVMYVFVVAMGWLIGGLYEEIAFHGFIFTRIEKMNAGRYSTIIAVLITSLIFGAYHFQLGIAGVLNAFIAGLGYHLLMLKFNRNLWYSFFAHGAFDTVAISMIYFGYL